MLFYCRFTYVYSISKKFLMEGKIYLFWPYNMTFENCSCILFLRANVG